MLKHALPMAIIASIISCGSDTSESDNTAADQIQVIDGTQSQTLAQTRSSDCTNRLQDWSQGPAACVVIRDNRALLVRVPYGSNPGWDFPGGYNKGGEFACQTAERETCEESGYAVRAIGKISYNVFLCEVVASNACRQPVDEGFLEKGWFNRNDIERLSYRGGSWGDKKGILRSKLGW
ncbi:NUDIX hydrolase [Pseudobacteriovorax antillogorgiicola]|uniref:ADP-ribose pyrophosphatase YjhB, NUDIX family n=1 Tax=Pseudobacteriovorax antillogorgiicola TaxID=1513793 RepID=A0A1Y6CKK6_9BACT|nr:NUDIX hydrolase [Pseudobacteriovorax antillogorgiicola]TCS47644.1 ADP-ribose pyrophosphatase YjhB (NUDIX family) [Pseudobacteriovorax antillogorgiicola]SMF59875.1 ADP-ribose pyrophosphatase YjhB, NUDIX family [Pseudobacteriovorax antillogorgiicola]